MNFVGKCMQKQFGFRSVFVFLVASSLIATAINVWLRKIEEIDAVVTLPISYYDPDFPPFDKFLRELEDKGKTGYDFRHCIIPSKFRCYEIRKISTDHDLKVVYKIEMDWYDLDYSVEYSEFLIECNYSKK